MHGHMNAKLDEKIVPHPQRERERERGGRETESERQRTYLRHHNDTHTR